MIVVMDKDEALKRPSAEPTSEELSNSSMPDTSPRHPKVFISYSPDSTQHKDRVLSLADGLRKFGFDCELEDISNCSSNSMRQFGAADFVLVEWTETYHRWFCGVQPGETVVTKDLLEAKRRSGQLLRIVFSSTDDEHIPDVFDDEHIPDAVRTLVPCDPETSQGFRELLRSLITEEARHPASPRRLPSFFNGSFFLTIIVGLTAVVTVSVALVGLLTEAVEQPTVAIPIAVSAFAFVVACVLLYVAVAKTKSDVGIFHYSSDSDPQHWTEHRFPSRTRWFALLGGILCLVISFSLAAIAYFNRPHS